MSDSGGTYVGIQFHQLLSRLLKARGLSQQNVADNLNVHQTQVSKWIRGLNTPDVFQGLGLARLVGVPLEPLVDGSCESLEQLERLSDIYSLVKELGLERARSRLLGMDDQPASGGYAVPLAIRDLTESDLKREREARAAAKRKPKGPGKP